MVGRDEKPELATGLDGDGRADEVATILPAGFRFSFSSKKSSAPLSSKSSSALISSSEGDDTRVAFWIMPA